ncbi:MAG: transcriptional regulator [Actinomycetota bacterium]|nr:transcriptional regulator [Actinomycetota bacterium]
MRLRICAYLAGCDEVSFKAVQEFCALTQPNLSKHLTSLAARDYVTIRKVAAGRRTETRLQLTHTGETALNEHVQALQELITTARAQEPVAPR